MFRSNLFLLSLEHSRNRSNGLHRKVGAVPGYLNPRRHNPEGGSLHIHRCDNLKYHNIKEDPKELRFKKTNRITLAQDIV